MLKNQLVTVSYILKIQLVVSYRGVSYKPILRVIKTWLNMLRKCTSKFSMLGTNVEKRRIMSDYSYTKCIYFILNYRRNTAQTYNIH